MHPGNRVGVIARDLPRPWPDLLASLPATCIKQNHITRTCLHTRLLFPTLEVATYDRRPRFYPFHALELRDVVQDSSCEDPVLPVHHAAFLAAGFRCDVVLHGHAVVHLTVLEEVAPRVDVRHGQAVIADRIGIGRATFRNPVGRSAKQSVGADISRHLLRLICCQRDNGAALDQFDRVHHLLGRDQV